MIAQSQLRMAPRANRSMQVVVAHPGTQHSPKLAVEFARRGSLAAYYTGVAFAGDGLIDRASRLLPARWRERLHKRRIADLPARQLRSRLVQEVIALWRLRQGGGSQEVWHRRSEHFQNSIPTAAIASASAVIGFDTASWILAERCSTVGIPFVLDQTIAHPDAKRLINEVLAEQYPAWLDPADSRLPIVRRAEQQEHDLATRIVVASTFVRDSLAEHGVAPDKIRVNPYGVDLQQFQPASRPANAPLRFAFVGAVRGRKGVPLLVDAWRALKPAGAELWIIGGVSPANRRLIPELPGLKVLGPLPRAEVAAALTECDIFVFPSLFEGFGLVILEAMATGLPAIVSDATAAADIVTPGHDGWIIPSGNLERLTECMNHCLENPRAVRERSPLARSTAERFSWQAYGDRWMSILAEVVR